MTQAHATTTDRLDQCSDQADTPADDAPDNGKLEKQDQQTPEIKGENAAEDHTDAHGPRRPTMPGAEDWKPSRIRRFFERLEARISRLSTRNNFWHRVCSWVFLPLAYRSGIRFGEQSENGKFNVVLPFRRFNKNWYNAMAGAALLGNSEVAGGMYVFQRVGGDYTVVCKNLNYKFMRPCLGPAVYRVVPREDIEEAVAHGGEFNITVDMDVYQAVIRMDERERRVGKCEATFHVAPKTKFRQRKAAMKAKAKAAKLQ